MYVVLPAQYQSHISKRKFLYMLQNGYIDYEDNGNKTHRYSLKMSDVEALWEESKVGTEQLRKLLAGYKKAEK